MDSVQVYQKRREQADVSTEDLMDALTATSAKWIATKAEYASGNGIEEAAYIVLLVLELYGKLAIEGQVTDLKDYRPVFIAERPIATYIRAIQESVQHNNTVPIEQMTPIINRFMGLYGYRKLVDRMYDLLVHRPPFRLNIGQII